MISKRSRRTVDSSEKLNQFSITGIKGIDISKPATSLDTVKEITNFDIAADGGLELRKPMVLRRNLSKHIPVEDGHTVNILHVYKLFFKSYSLVIYEDNNLPMFIILDGNGVLQNYIVEFFDYLTGETYRSDLLETRSVPIDLTEAFLTNGATASILTNVRVDLTDDFFKINDPGTSERKTVIYRPDLYDTEGVVKNAFRTIQIYRDNSYTSGDTVGTFVVRVCTPNMNTLDISGTELALDANFALDNPYAVRDEYLSPAPTVKGIKVYFPTKNTYGKSSVDVEFSKDYTTTAQINGFITTKRVEDLTESVKSDRFNIVSAIQRVSDAEINKIRRFPILKAFCAFPKSSASYGNCYAHWEISFDGVTWTVLDIPAGYGDGFLGKQAKDGGHNMSVWVPKYSKTTSGTIDSSGNVKFDTSVSYESETFYKVVAEGSNNLINDRIDVLVLDYFTNTNAGNSGAGGTGDDKINTLFRGATFKFKMISIREEAEGDPGFNDGKFPHHVEDVVLGEYTYMPMFDTQFDVLYPDFGNASEGASLYYNSTLYTYGIPSLQNNIFASNPGELIRPLSKLIDLAAYEDVVVTSLTPWRDSLIATTEKSIYLLTKSDTGYVTKVINASIGIPVNDAKCIKPLLNGLMFKSGSRMYMLYPNLYSGDETTLNITDITTPIEDYLEYSYNGTPFAISTENAYYLFLPDEKPNSVDNITHCLKYNYTAKTWTHYTYPGIFFGYDMLSVDDIRVYVKLPQGIVGEFNIESEYKDLFDNVPETLPYGDLLTESDEGIAADVANWNGDTSFVTPIKFEVDTGQKSDNFTYTKQFCESKFIVATKHVKDTFPMSVVVHTDGNLRTHRIDVTTDAAFWKNSISHLGTLSTTFNSVFEDNLDTFRQMFLRYSGKGKSIRYIISGESLYKFKIYEIFSRYKNPNVKQ